MFSECELFARVLMIIMIMVIIIIIITAVTNYNLFNLITSMNGRTFIGEKNVSQLLGETESFSLSNT
jgi:membrane-anchored glycerophosphoryl diester phosphodiesterase (GDPDase)